jgi:cardiolipin synthase
MGKTLGKLFTIPNLLSAFRFLAAPFVFFFFTLPGLEGRLLTLLFLLISFSTDYFDGFFARRLKQQTDLGRMLDPIADKAIVLALMVAVVIFRNVAFYYLIAILSRDLLILAGGLIIKLKRGIVVESNIWGKAATFILMTSFLFFIFPELEIPAYVLLYAGLAAVAVSFVTYCIVFFRMMKKKQPAPPSG